MARPGKRPSPLAEAASFRIGALLVQPDRLVVLRDGESIALEPRCMEVLVALAEHAGEVVSADQLLIEVWRGSFYGDNPVHKTIALLRRQLGDDSRNPRYIETIRKRGYRIVAPVAFPSGYRAGAIAAGSWSGGNPYRGLAAFDQAHAGLFFGRGRTIAQVIEAIRAQLRSQRRFVLVSGASGCGKTSLMQAGVVPLLSQPGGIDGLQALSVAQCDLSASPGIGAVEALATAMGEWRLQERPLFLPAQHELLARQLVEAPEQPRAQIDDALRRLGSRQVDGATGAHLLLVIDHAEALVASDDDSATQRAVQAAIAGLCASPRVVVVMLVRSDFYPRLVEALPLVADLKRGDGHLDLLAPQPGEFAQIIRLPAHCAGLEFEEDASTGARLDDVLLAAASDQPDALPLLQHVLHGLYERRTEDGVLTFAAYRALGGLEGALAQAAEGAYASVPAAASAALDLVLSHLVVVHPDTEHVTARPIAWQSLTDAGARALAEAFVRARLFVGDLSGSQPALAIAHEALLRQWPRAREWVRDNRRLLQVRERLQWAARRWQDEGRRRDLLLSGGRPLDEARDAARRLPRPLDADSRSYLRASERQQRRRHWLRGAAIGTLTLLTTISIALGLKFRHAQRVAEARHDEAQQLATYLLGDLAEQLRKAGNLKLLDSVGNQALAYLERLPQADMGPRELVSHARALRTVGEVLFNQAQFDIAGQVFARAHAVALQALARDANADEPLSERGLSSYWLGYLAYRQKQYAQAQVHWDDYLDATTRLRERTPADPRWQLEMSYALNNLGTLAHARQDDALAAALFDSSIGLKQQVLAVHPDDAAVRYELVDSLSWFSSSQESQGQLQAAEAGYREQIGMLRALVAAETDADAWRRRLATSLLRSSALALAQGRLQQAARDAQESRQLLTALARKQPDNAVWQRDLAHAAAQVGWLALLRGDQTQAREGLGAAATLIAPLLQKPKPPPEWRWMAATVELRRAQLAALQRPAALAQVDAAIDRMETLHAALPDDTLGVSLLASALAWRGERLEAQQAHEAARADWNRIRQLLGDLAPRSRDRALLDPWVRAEVHLGHRQQVTPVLSWLRDSGYRHPGFVALYDVPNQEMQHP